MSLVMLCGILSLQRPPENSECPHVLRHYGGVMRKLLLTPLAIACILGVASASAAVVETFVLFDPDASERPESIQVDRHGHVYVSLAPLGEIRKIAPDSTQSTLAFLPLRRDIVPCQNSAGSAGIAGIALDHQRNVYVGVRSCNALDFGIWKVTPDGEQQLVANLPSNSGPNGIAYHGGWLYVADSRLARVWRVHADGQSLAEIWTDDPLLQHPSTPPPGFPGPNGLQVFHDEVYVSVSSRAHIVAFPINADGSAGPGRVHIDEIGLDDFVFDVKGNLYAMTNFFNTVVRITPDDVRKTLLDFDDLLDGPSAGAFGTGDDNKTLYITNIAIPNFPGQQPRRRPSIMRLHVGIPGKPRP